MRRVCIVAIAAIAVWIPAAAASASNWLVPLAAGSRGMAQAVPLPQATGVTATCAPAGKITISWQGSAHADYDIFQASDTTAGPWTQITSSWPSTTYTLGYPPTGHTYYFEVQPRIHLSSWYGAMSAPSNGRRISGNSCL